MRYICKVFDRANDQCIGHAEIDVTPGFEQQSFSRVKQVAGAYADDVTWEVRDETGCVLFAGAN